MTRGATAALVIAIIAALANLADDELLTSLATTKDVLLAVIGAVVTAVASWVTLYLRPGPPPPEA